MAKKYKLDDGSMVTALEVSARAGIGLKTARTRLSIHTDPVKVFEPKQIRNKFNGESYKMRRIKSRGMFDEMLVLALKVI